MIYSGGDFADLEQVVAETTLALGKRAHIFDSIVVRGVSGLSVGAPVALSLGKPLVVVRKPGENSHSFRKLVNGKRIGARWLFLDDFMDSGTTKEACVEGVKAAWRDYECNNTSVHSPPALVACYFYEDSDWRPGGWCPVVDGKVQRRKVAEPAPAGASI